jgi:hypothetical protein
MPAALYKPAEGQHGVSSASGRSVTAVRRAYAATSPQRVLCVKSDVRAILQR